MSRENQDRPESAPCPRCGRIASHPEECVHCGVVFAKLHRGSGAAATAGARPSGLAPPNGPVVRHARPAGNRRLGLLVGLLALAFTTLAVVNAESDRETQAALAMASATAATPAERAETAVVPTRRTVAEPHAPSARPAHRAPSVATPRVTGAADTADPERPREVSISHDWYEGADGFLEGMEEAQHENKAALIYFYTDWCPYCRRLDRDLLARTAVSATTKYFVKIKINPEHGPGERLLADRYGIGGYPSLYVHEAGSARHTKIGTNTKGRLKRPSEFADSLTRAAGERFTGR